MNAFTSDTSPAPAFTIRNLSVMNFAQGFTQWHYRGTSNTLAETQAPGFFSGANVVKYGDFIMVSAADGAMMVYVEADETITVMSQTAPRSIPMAGRPATGGIGPISHAEMACVA